MAILNTAEPTLAPSLGGRVENSMIQGHQPRGASTWQKAAAHRDRKLLQPRLVD